MKLKVYKENEPEEKVLTLRLVENSNTSVTLVAVDKNGEAVLGGYLLNISKKGIELYRNISKDLGLALDKSHGSIKVIG